MRFAIIHARALSPVTANAGKLAPPPHPGESVPDDCAAIFQSLIRNTLLTVTFLCPTTFTQEPPPAGRAS